jgi:hypothetical protein
MGLVALPGTLGCALLDVLRDGEQPVGALVDAAGLCAALPSSRYGKRLVTDPDDRLGYPLLGEPAADFGE